MGKVIKRSCERANPFIVRKLILLGGQYGTHGTGKVKIDSWAQFYEWPTSLYLQSCE